MLFGLCLGNIGLCCAFNDLTLLQYSFTTLFRKWYLGGFMSERFFFFIDGHNIKWHLL